MSALRQISGLILSIVAMALLVTPGLGQERSSRTLFEFLFGSQNQPQQQAPAPQPQPQPQAQPRPQPQPQPQQTRPAPRPAPVPAPQPVQSDKSENARRIAVFGDSLGVDLARALERLYADNPEMMVLEESVGSSGFVRDDFFDWNEAIEAEIARDSFDVAVVAIGINDRQELANADPLSDAWRETYRGRLDAFLADLGAAGKEVIWIELPPMEQPSYGAAMVQISSIHKSAVDAAGANWVETYERYMGENGGYSIDGPDLNGNIVAMRRGDGIHFSAAGADKLAFYVDRALGTGSSGGRVSASGSTSEVADLLAGTDAASMLRPPFQGLDQMRLVEMASIIQDLGGANQRAGDLIIAGSQTAGTQRFSLDSMLNAPAGRIDAFGATPAVAIENASGR
ncbi:DUF459 domain-containing protein [Pelagibacterium luteolum]|uniref:SGNH hydrolase-type esterase domain-containing protein n=1 Tax=Pelagibacterium luteolum TaxID=440168 RepID=A0A1G7WSK2_9HYPH|nr:DUF459 domain-containing protein [Pelagibacterium luteolum]SDG74937.1 hypothetical protein SAMN04487974_10791 [Pelagibacterium luteolum]